MTHGRMKVFAAAALAAFVCAGCASVAEVGKTIWGSSVRELEKARAHAVSRTYHKGYWDCMRALLKVIGENTSSEFTAGDLDVVLLRNSLKERSKENDVIREQSGLSSDQLDNASQDTLLNAFNKVLKMRDLYAKIDPNKYKAGLPLEIQPLLEKAQGHDLLTGQEVLSLNAALLRAMYPREIQKIQGNSYLIFQKDEVKGYVVIMGIPGYVNTTEVGIFLVEVSDNETRVEMSSLSTNAKRAAAKTLFKGLDKILSP